MDPYPASLEFIKAQLAIYKIDHCTEILEQPKRIRILVEPALVANVRARFVCNYPESHFPRFLSVHGIVLVDIASLPGHIERFAWGRRWWSVWTMMNNCLYHMGLATWYYNTSWMF